MADGAAPASDPSPERLRLTTVSTLVLVGWSLFVWGGRIRNTVVDDTLGAADRLGPQLLAVSFVIPSLVLSALLVRRRLRPFDVGRSKALTIGLRLFALWTTGVWVLRAGDIALGGDHELGFVIVHLVLAVVSIAAAACAVVADDRSRRSAKGEPVGVS